MTSHDESSRVSLLSDANVSQSAASTIGAFGDSATAAFVALTNEGATLVPLALRALTVQLTRS